VLREITTRHPPCFDHMYTSWSVCFRWDQMCNVLVLPVTSSSPRRPRDITSRVNPSCLPTGAVESPRPSICLAQKVHSGEVSIHPMTWAEDSREPMPWPPCPFGRGSLPFPEVGDDVGSPRRNRSANPCRHGPALIASSPRDRSATDPG